MRDMSEACVVEWREVARIGVESLDFGRGGQVFVAWAGRTGCAMDFRGVCRAPDSLFLGGL